MRNVLPVIVGVFLVIAVAAAAVFVAAALASNHSRGKHFDWDAGWLSRAHVVLVLVGWGAFVFFGVKGVLFWLPSEWDEFAFTLAGVAAVCSIPLLQIVNRLPKVRRQLQVLSAATSWEREQLLLTQQPSPELLLRLEQAQDDTTRPLIEREIAGTKLGFAQTLAERDSLREQLLMRRLREEQLTREESDKKRQREDTQQRHLTERANALRRLTADLPTAADVDSLYGSGSTLIAADVVEREWAVFKNRVMQARPKSPDDVEAAADRLREALAEIPGIQLPTGRIRLRWSGDNRDGACDAVVEVAGVERPLAVALFFEESLEGLLQSLFISVALASAWSWGHGRYDRDDELLLTARQLLRAVGETELPLADKNSWPPAGPRIRKTAKGFSVDCLALKPGKSIYDISVDVNAGQASAPLRRGVHHLGSGVLY